METPHPPLSGTFPSRGRLMKVQRRIAKFIESENKERAEKIDAFPDKRRYFYVNKYDLIYLLGV